MVSLFGPLKIDPERKLIQVKQRSAKRLILPFILGSLIVGGVSATIQAVSHRRSWVEALGLAGAGGLAASYVVAVGNQSGTSESNRQILLAADRMEASSEGLCESAKITQERLDVQQLRTAESNQSNARLMVSLKATTDSIDRFGAGIHRMTQSGGFAPQQPPVYEVHPPQPPQPPVETPAETAEEPEFPLEAAANDYPVTDNFQQEGW